MVFTNKLECNTAHNRDLRCCFLAPPREAAPSHADESVTMFKATRRFFLLSNWRSFGCPAAVSVHPIACSQPGKLIDRINKQCRCAGLMHLSASKRRHVRIAPRFLGCFRREFGHVERWRRIYYSGEENPITFVGLLCLWTKKYRPLSAAKWQRGT